MSQRILHADRVRYMIANALAHGAVRMSMMRTRWDMSVNCENPFTTEVIGRPSDPDGGKYVTIGRKTEQTAVLELVTRCRKCAPCLKARARLWSYRAREETTTASRTWFGTLTLKPQAQFIALSKARAAFPGFDELPEDKRFARVVSEVSREITLALKRIRKNSGVSFRYLVVCEAHKSGNPHFHVLLHERSPMHKVTYAVLDKAWPLGFTKWRLVKDPKEASYLAKYLAKDVRARVRASRHYGSGFDLRMKSDPSSVQA